jgi:SH3-like domain-containing protein
MNYQSHLSILQVLLKHISSPSCSKHGSRVSVGAAALCIILFFHFFIVTGNASALCVKVPEANLRSGPGSGYERTWAVFKYMPFKKIKKKGSWYQVKDFEGDSHWIYQKLVTDKFDCAVVKVEKANARTGPGTQYKKSSLSPSIQYDSFKVLKRKGKWVKVLDEFGETGWIFRKLLWIY